MYEQESWTKKRAETILPKAVVTDKDYVIIWIRSN